MKILSSLVVVGAVWGGYHLFTVHQAARAMRDLLATSDVNGFVEVLPPANQDLGTIYVVAAQNCPHADAQTADQLAKSLGRQGIPVVRVSSVSYPSQQIDRATMNRLMVVMNGPLPLVFVHGRAAMNPEVNQVVEEYYRPGPVRAPR
jgi:hypothetical protein